MSLRFRLNLLIAALLLLFMLAVGYVILKGTKSSIQEGVEAATRVTVQLLDTVVVSSIQNPEWGYTHDVMRRFLEHLGHVRSNEIYLYSLNGALLFQSPPSKYRADITPPEWFEHMLNPHEPSVSRLIRFGKLIVNPNPAGAIREAWSKMRILFWVGLGFFIFLNGIVYWMLGRWLQPLQPMLRVINRMEQGDLSARLPHFNLSEFDSIAQNFNLMGESLQKSTSENQRLALIAQQTADAMIIHDLNGNISFWNMAAQKIFGYAPQDIIGQSASVLIPKGQEHDLIENRRAINHRRNVENHDTQRQARDGRIIDVSISAAPLIDPVSNLVIGDICSMRDITERKQVEIAERKAATAESKLEENRQVTHLIQKHIEDERRSLARELHDELGQYVTAIKTFAVAIANKTKEKAPEVEASAQTIVAAANHIYDGMHNIIRQLRPGSLDNLGLSATLQDTVNNVQKQYPNLKINLDLSGNLESLGESLNINIYRIVQESINNAIKHSEAKHIDVKLAVNEKGALELTIKDDGIGMNVDSVDQSNHFGLLGMRERVQGFKGSFMVDSAPYNQSATKIGRKAASDKKAGDIKTGTTIYIHIPQAVDV